MPPDLTDSADLAEARDLAALLRRWRDDLAAWAIPEDILAAAPDSPWVLPHQVFARRADRVSASPSGLSFELARAALEPPGTVLDVGAGAGAACLPLLPRLTALAAVDTDAQMLRLLAQRAGAAGLQPRLIAGRWPDVAAQAAPADLVTCHHVTYNVPDIQPFLAALSASARRRVVIEMTVTHPLASLNDLWLHFHGLRRPSGPTAAGLIAILTAMGVPVLHRTWRRPGGRDYASFDELIDVTRRRLCLPPERAAEVAAALTAAGVDPAHPVDLGSSGQEVATIWWDRRAAG